MYDRVCGQTWNQNSDHDANERSFVDSVIRVSVNFLFRIVASFHMIKHFVPCLKRRVKSTPLKVRKLATNKTSFF